MSQVDVCSCCCYSSLLGTFSVLLLLLSSEQRMSMFGAYCTLLLSRVAASLHGVLGWWSNHPSIWSFQRSTIGRTDNECLSHHDNCYYRGISLFSLIHLHTDWSRNDMRTMPFPMLFSIIMIHNWLIPCGYGLIPAQPRFFCKAQKHPAKKKQSEKQSDSSQDCSPCPEFRKEFKSGLFSIQYP